MLTKMKSLLSYSPFRTALLELLVDVVSIAAIYWLLYYLNSPWWGYLLVMICVAIQKAIADKK